MGNLAYMWEPLIVTDSSILDVGRGPILWTTLLVHPLKTFSIWRLKTEFFQLLTDQLESHGQVLLQ